LGKSILVEVDPYMASFCTFWQSAFSVTLHYLLWLEVGKVHVMAFCLTMCMLRYVYTTGA
jgi:hypothetical protein